MKSPPFDRRLESDAPAATAASAAGAAAPDAAGLDAPPSNRASNSCKRDDSFRLLGFGIDSLDLSFQGSTDPFVESQLKYLKELAQSRDPREVASARIELHGSVFHVRDKGSGLYPFVLDSNRLRVCLASTRSTKLPMAFVQLRSSFLVEVGAQAAAIEASAVATELGMVDGSATVPRLDLCADYTTDSNLAVDERAWVTRLRGKNAYWDESRLSGWAMGYGGPLVFRNYDKTLEIEQKSKKYYLYEIWKEKGWFPVDRVWRAEFEIRREMLARFSGLRAVAEVLWSIPSLWKFLVEEGVRLTIPSETDETRARWPNHPLWNSLAEVPWPGNEIGLTRRVLTPTSANSRMVARQFASAVSTVMAAEGIIDPEVARELAWRITLDDLDLHGLITGKSAARALEDKALVKARRWNIARGDAADLTKAPLPVDAQLYRQESGR